MPKLITDPDELRLTVDPKADLTVKAEDVQAEAKKLGFSCYVLSSEEAVKHDMENLKPFRWDETDEADRFFSMHRVDYPPADRIGYTSIPVLEFLNGRPWNNGALQVVHAVRPSCIRVTTGECTADSVSWRVTVFLAADRRTIRRIEQEVDVRLIGSRYGADVAAFIAGRPPAPIGGTAIINPRGIEKLKVE